MPSSPTVVLTGATTGIAVTDRIDPSDRGRRLRRMVGRDRVRHQHLRPGHALGDRRQVGRVQALRQRPAVRRRGPAPPFGARFSADAPFRPVNIRAIYADDEQRTVAVDGTAFYDSIAFDELWETVSPGG